MDIKIICEEEYEKIIWCKQILSGLTSELKKKRHHYSKTNQIEEVENNSTVYIIGTNHNWLNHAIRFCNSKGIVPIVLCNQANRVIRGRYHCVCADTYGVIKKLYDDFSKAGKKQIALYGVNPISASDASRMEYFLELVQDRGHVFENKGNLEECFQRFLPYLRQYDAVICVNSYAAISLVKKIESLDPDILSRLSIVSCTENLLSSQYRNRIAFIDLNLEQYGKAAITISEIAESKPYISSITTTITGNISGSVCSIPSTDIEPVPRENQSDLFYDDEELAYMLKLEHLLSECSETDQQIIDLLLQNTTYGRIAEICFLSENTVKYHIKKYMDICNVKTKQELLKLLKGYYISLEH